MSFGLEDMVKAVRWAAMVVITTILAGMAAASDDGKDAPLTPQAQSEVAQSGTEGAPGGSASQTQPPPALDRRDRIFYPGDTERPKPLIRKLFLNILLDQKDRSAVPPTFAAVLFPRSART